MRVLVVEGEPVLARNLAEGLRDVGFAVDVALDGTSALAKIGLVEYDVLMVDEANLTNDRDRATLYQTAARTGCPAPPNLPTGS